MHSMLRGATIAFVLNVLARLLTFLLNIQLARLLGAQGLGVYLLAVTITSIGTVLGRIGLDNILLRYTAANAAQGNWEGVASAYRTALFIAFTLSVAVTMIVVGSADWISRGIFFDPALADPLRLMALGILPQSLLLLHAEALRGLERIASSVLVQSVSVPLFSLPLVAVLIGPLGILGAAIANLISTILVVTLGTILWRQATPQLRGIRGTLDTHRMLALSLPLFWLALLNLAMTITDTLLLGIWSGSEAVGIYGVANRTAQVIGFVLIPVSSIAAPRFASLHAQEDRLALGTLAQTSARLTAFLAVPLLLLFVLIPARILSIFGKEFIGGALSLSILAIGQFVNAATGPVGYLLIMTGHEKLMRNSAIISTALNVILQLLLIPAYGLHGAALASATTMITTNIISVVLAYRKLSILVLPIRPPWSSKETPCAERQLHGK